MNKNIIIYIGLFLFVSIIWFRTDKIKSNLELKIIEQKNKIEQYQNRIDSLSQIDKKIEYKIDTVIIEKEKEVIKYRTKIKEVESYDSIQIAQYFKKHFSDSLHIIKINEERLHLLQIKKLQKKEIKLLNTRIDLKDNVISNQNNIIKSKDIIIETLENDNKKLRKENKLIKIGATVLTGALIIIAI